MLKKLHKTLTAKSKRGAVLIANAMFSSKHFPMKKAFVATNKANFQCESRSLDFSNPKEAADEINEWVNNKTSGRSHGWFFLAQIGPFWGVQNDLLRVVGTDLAVLGERLLSLVYIVLTQQRQTRSNYR